MADVQKRISEAFTSVVAQADPEIRRAMIETLRADFTSYESEFAACFQVYEGQLRCKIYSEFLDITKLPENERRSAHRALQARYPECIVPPLLFRN